MEQTAPRYRTLGLGVALGALAAVALLVAELGGALMAVMALVVVAAGLTLGPTRTLIVAGAAIAAGLLITFGLDIELKPLRLAAVTGGSLLGVAVAWAIEHRVRRISRLARTQERIFDAVPDGLLVLDNDGRTVLANDALADLVPEATQGERVHPLLGHLLADGVECPGGCLLDDPSHLGENQSVEVVEGECFVIDGDTVHIEYTAARVDAEQCVVSLRDVTALVAADEDRRALLEAATRQREQEVLLRALGSPQHISLPAVAGVELDMWSTTAGPDSPSGGDIIDVSEAPDGRVLILVVDALGAGVMSVRDAWKVLYVSRAHFAAGVALSDLVSRTAATLSVDAEPPKASVLAAVLDPATGHLELATGGHPPALLVHDDGTSVWLEATGRGIGAPLPGSQGTISGLLSSTDSLVLYTDGVVDGTRDIVAGLTNLKASATALRRRPTDGWTHAVMDAVLTPGQARGDATMLLVRLAPQSDERQSSAIL